MKLVLICSVRSYPFVAYQLKYLLLSRCNPNELLWRTWVAPDGAASTPQSLLEKSMSELYKDSQ